MSDTDCESECESTYERIVEELEREWIKNNPNNEIPEEKKQGKREKEEKKRIKDDELRRQKKYKENERERKRKEQEEEKQRIRDEKNKKKKERVAKLQIPSQVKKQTWNKYIGQHIALHKCMCCKIEEIKQGSFHCGHVISEKNGGKIELNNLRPICQGCNLSMGTTDMNEYIIRHGYLCGN
jgi:5-methylcytosine-specific restriction endonuclease McrA